MSIVTSGLYAYYNSIQGVSSSKWQDLSGNARDASVNGVSLDADGYNFTGSTSQYIKVPSPTSDITSYSIEGVINVRAQSIQSTLLGWMWNTSANFDNYLGLETSGLVRSFVGSDTSNAAKDSTTAIAYNTSQHVGMTATGTTVKLYVNGSPSGTFTVPTLEPISALANTFIYIGLRPGANDRPLKGHMQVVRIYNRALSDAEMAQNYAVGTAVGLVEKITHKSKQKITGERTLPVSLVGSKNTAQLIGTKNSNTLQGSKDTPSMLVGSRVSNTLGGEI